MLNLIETIDRYRLIINNSFNFNIKLIIQTQQNIKYDLYNDILNENVRRIRNFNFTSITCYLLIENDKIFLTIKNANNYIILIKGFYQIFMNDIDYVVNIENSNNNDMYISNDQNDIFLSNLKNLRVGDNIKIITKDTFNVINNLSLKRYNTNNNFIIGNTFNIIFNNNGEIIFNSPYNLGNKIFITIKNYNQDPLGFYLNLRNFQNNYQYFGIFNNSGDLIIPISKLISNKYYNIGPVNIEYNIE